MPKLLQLVVMTATLVGSASLALAQDARTRNEAWRTNDTYNANASVETGRYVAPRRQSTLPGLPFTWEEKRHFDMANGEQG
jgi:hypothetical protein